jgi:HTH-type transcriptional regulator / antitoxin HigA
MTLTIYLNNYLQLWATLDISPNVIESEAEYRQFLLVTQNLLVKKNMWRYE